MALVASLALFAAAGLGLGAITVQILLVRRHLRGAPPVARVRPPISILKPLCGIDDELEANLASFAHLDYPEYEVCLGVRGVRDPAFGVALETARRWPGRFRVVLQRGEPGLNPKVNQLMTLERAARHDLLVVSDSNVRVEPGYLAEIAALLEEESVGLVTHPISGAGAERLGALLDHLHLAGSITPAIVTTRRLAGRDIVVGKSMAMRRRDLEALGGFAAVRDVLAEDYVMGRMVSAALGKRVAVARRPIRNVCCGATVGQFAARYRRWGVLQRQAAGPLAYAGLALLNPVLLAACGAALARTAGAAACLGAVCAAKMVLDEGAARALRPGGFRLHELALVPVKDLLFGAAWAFALFRHDVAWRGTRIRVGPGTRIEAPRREEFAAAASPAA